jgi:WD40 repeat protein
MRSILVSCGGADSVGSLAIRPDNLASLTTFDSLKCNPTKHATAISSPFILTVATDRSKRLISTHITGISPRGECTLPGDVECIDCCSNYFATGSADGFLRLWRVSDGELLIEQHLHIGALSVVVIDTLLWVIFAGSTTGQIGAWSIPELFNSGESYRVWSIHTLKVTDLCLSCGGRVFSVSLDRTAKCFDFAVGCEILAKSFPSPLTACTLLHNESVLYCGASDGNVYQVQLAQDGGVRPAFQGHTMEITDLLVSDDDRSLFSCGLDGVVRRWDTATGQTMQQIQVKGVPFAIRWLPEVDAPRNEGPKHRKTKKEAIAARQELKKGFPRLLRAISGNRDELVTAEVEDIEVLTLEDEMAIAVADICANQPVQEANAIGETITTEKDSKDAEIRELRKKNGAMLQLVLAHGYKE